jgi:hypothetical protein
MPDRRKVEVFSQPKQVNEVSEFVQILYKDERNLLPKEHAEIRAFLRLKLIAEYVFHITKSPDHVELFQLERRKIETVEVEERSRSFYLNYIQSQV